MKSDNVHQVNCPTCQTPVIWKPANENRPFCSERCKLIDLGDWAAQKHSIAGDPIYPDVGEESDSV
ncbi:MAG: DNA gyrase inhibitor YacG [Gammaproteobacteria bacterium]|nr:DNA gyrase inhibitor YacG [Gammaproteobacteria bacterium]HBW83758.1 DNA gyrase inhibitor YacG [Gammaproteobacteria bacterium]|tara:strand:- start:305 stop:502 length:198 start_codon:yes stop_codon:yes gene_type:complete